MQCSKARWNWCNDCNSCLSPTERSTCHPCPSFLLIHLAVNPTALKILSARKHYFHIVYPKIKQNAKYISWKMSADITNDLQKWAILKPKLRRAWPLKWHLDGQQLGSKSAHKLYALAQQQMGQRSKRSETISLAGRRKTHTAGRNVTCASWLLTRSAGRCSVVGYGAIWNASDWLTRHFTGLPLMPQLIWGYVLHVQNKFDRGEIWVQLVFNGTGILRCFSKSIGWLWWYQNCRR